MLLFSVFLLVISCKKTNFYDKTKRLARKDDVVVYVNDYDVVDEEGQIYVTNNYKNIFDLDNKMKEYILQANVISAKSIIRDVFIINIHIMPKTVQDKLYALWLDLLFKDYNDLNLLINNKGEPQNSDELRAYKEEVSIKEEKRAQILDLLYDIDENPHNIKDRILIATSDSNPGKRALKGYVKLSVKRCFNTIDREKKIDDALIHFIFKRLMKKDSLFSSKALNLFIPFFEGLGDNLSFFIESLILEAICDKVSAYTYQNIFFAIDVVYGREKKDNIIKQLSDKGSAVVNSAIYSPSLLFYMANDGFDINKIARPLICLNDNPKGIISEDLSPLLAVMRYNPGYFGILLKIGAKPDIKIRNTTVIAEANKSSNSEFKSLLSKYMNAKRREAGKEGRPLGKK